MQLKNVVDELNGCKIDLENNFEQEKAKLNLTVNLILYYFRLPN
jgi:hypothetical protein